MITYAGIPLLIPDEDGDLARFLDHYLPLQETYLFGPTRHAVSAKCAPPFATGHPTGLGVPNYPPPPPLKINSLYWPTGASRWSRFCGLCTTEQLGDLLAKDVFQASNSVAEYTQSNANPAPFLELNDQDRFNLKTRMYLLPARQLTVEVDGEEGVWLLPLVDQRFYQQFTLGGTGAIASDWTWNQLISSLLISYKMTWDTVPADYFYPDWQEFGRRVPAGDLLDAIAHSIGMRYVRWIDGKTKLMNWNTSEERLRLNLEDAGFDVFGELAGGSFRFPGGILPNTVSVVFPRYQHGRTMHRHYNATDGDLIGAAAVTFHQVNRNGALYTESDVRNSGLTIYSTAAADCTLVNNSGGSVSDRGVQNQFDLEDLADQIATDHVASLKYRYDRTFASIKPWHPSGYDDFVEWSFGYRRADGSYAAQTRVQSPPYNFGVLEMCHQVLEKTYAHRPNHVSHGIGFNQTSSSIVRYVVPDSDSFPPAQVNVSGLGEDTLAGNFAWKIVIGGDWFIAVNLPVRFSPPGSAPDITRLILALEVLRNGASPQVPIIGEWGQDAGANADWSAGRCTLTASGILFNCVPDDLIQIRVQITIAASGATLNVEGLGGTVTFHRIDR